MSMLFTIFKGAFGFFFFFSLATLSDQEMAMYKKIYTYENIIAIAYLKVNYLG